MKKLLLLAALAMGCAMTSKANTFSIYNMTSGCTFSYFVVATDPGNTTTTYTSTQINVPPGTTTFSTPSSIPGYTGAPATVNYLFARGWVNGPPNISANVGNFPTQGFPTSQTLTSLGCNGGNTTLVNWNGNSTGGNVVILIF